jgi:hypothetical protein
MNRYFAGTLGAAAIALAVGACGDDSRASDDGAWGGTSTVCHQYSSCESCTPVVGCGWCYTGGGSGMCASDPDECSKSTTFTWTWEKTGCHVAPDASVVPVHDAGSNRDANSSGDANSDGDANAAGDANGNEVGTNGDAGATGDGALSDAGASDAPGG